MGAVNITLANGQLGATAQLNDGIVGLVCTGAIDGYTLGDPLLITSMANAVAQGVTEASSPFLYRILTEFYLVAGSGAKIYVLPLTNTTTLDAYAGDNEARKLLEFAGGKIKVLALTTDDTDVYGGSVTVTNSLNADVYTLVDSINTLAVEFADAHKPFRAIVAGTSFSGDVSGLLDLTEMTNNRVAVMIGDSERAPGDARDQSAIGLLLGRIASIPVQRKVSRVKDGKLPLTTAYVGPNDISLPAYVNDPASIEDAGYITWCTYPSVAGVFFSGDSTASAPTDDYHFLARGRVIDKAAVLAYQGFVEEVDDEVPVNADGTLEAGYCVALQTKISRSITNNMIANKEVTAVSCYIDPAQNVVANSKVTVALGVTPVGYATTIDVELGFQVSS